MKKLILRCTVFVSCSIVLLLASCGNKVKPNYDIPDEILDAKMQELIEKLNRDLPMLIDGIGSKVSEAYDNKRKTMISTYEVGWGVALNKVLNSNPENAKYRRIYNLSFVENPQEMARFGLDMEEVFYYYNLKKGCKDTISVTLTNKELRRALEDTRYRDSASVVWLTYLYNDEYSYKSKGKTKFILKDTVENNCFVRTVVVCRRSVFDTYKSIIDEMVLEESRDGNSRECFDRLGNAELDFVVRYVDAQSGEFVEGKLPYKAFKH